MTTTEWPPCRCGHPLFDHLHARVGLHRVGAGSVPLDLSVENCHGTNRQGCSTSCDGYFPNNIGPGGGGGEPVPVANVA